MGVLESARNLIKCIMERQNIKRLPKLDIAVHQYKTLLVYSFLDIDIIFCYFTVFIICCTVYRSLISFVVIIVRRLGDCAIHSTKSCCTCHFVSKCLKFHFKSGRCLGDTSTYENVVLFCSCKYYYRV